jgi:hypothetical protein
LRKFILVKVLCCSAISLWKRKSNLLLR